MEKINLKKSWVWNITKNAFGNCLHFTQIQLLMFVYITAWNHFSCFHLCYSMTAAIGMLCTKCQDYDVEIKCNERAMLKILIILDM
jgi:hypothetical protein